MLHTTGIPDVDDTDLDTGHIRTCCSHVIVEVVLPATFELHLRVLVHGRGPLHQREDVRTLLPVLQHQPDRLRVLGLLCELDRDL